MPVRTWVAPAGAEPEYRCLITAKPLRRRIPVPMIRYYGHHPV